ncbi:MAG: filamentous hemagglutinin N-terminal domain-containing protein [Alphaproteobacteria bacterium]|nr:filamentous hemagglutinin N-terminal domain-containing protein [Alphaproteobacteria bacterium]
MRANFNHIQTRFVATSALTAALLHFYPLSSAKAAPQGGLVVGGQATISKDGLNITQTSPRAAINWNSFNVDAHETVTFAVPNNGATLNRVVGNAASTIKGTVTSNGTLYLVNPNGLVFDTGSRISAQNFIATTADIDTNKFIQGGTLSFIGDKKLAGTINLRGEIKAADRGIIGIFAPTLRNEGVISAHLGRVTLGGTQSFVIDFVGDGLMQFELTDNWSVQNTKRGANGAYGDAVISELNVTNSGTITVDGGIIDLVVKTGRTSVPDTVVDTSPFIGGSIQNSGTLRAQSVEGKTGVITLRAGNNKASFGEVTLGGTLDASAGNDSNTPGLVKIDTNMGNLRVATSPLKIMASSAEFSSGQSVAIAGAVTVEGALTINSYGTIAASAKITADRLTITQTNKNLNPRQISKEGRQAISLSLADVEVRGDITITQAADVNFTANGQIDRLSLVGLDIGSMISTTGNITLNQTGALRVSGGTVNNDVYGIRANHLAAARNIILTQTQYVTSSQATDANGNSNEHNLAISSATAGNSIKWYVGSDSALYRQQNIVRDVRDIVSEQQAPYSYRLVVRDLETKSFALNADSSHGMVNGHWIKTRHKRFGQVTLLAWVPGLTEYRDLNVHLTELRGAPPVTFGNISPTSPTPVTPPVVALPVITSKDFKITYNGNVDVITNYSSYVPQSISVSGLTPLAASDVSVSVTTNYESASGLYKTVVTLVTPGNANRNSLSIQKVDFSPNAAANGSTAPTINLSVSLPNENIKISTASFVAKNPLSK